MTVDAGQLVVTLDTMVDPDWMRAASDREVFAYSCCGYWARGVEQQSDLGWLIWEAVEKCRPGEEPARDEALAAWRARTALPEGWLRLDGAAAQRAWVAGVRRWGESWFQRADQHRYDTVLQLALLAEVRYG